MAVRCRNVTRRRSSSVKMTDTLATCTKEEQRSVIRYLSIEGVNPLRSYLNEKLAAPGLENRD